MRLTFSYDLSQFTMLWPRPILQETLVKVVKNTPITVCVSHRHNQVSLGWYAARIELHKAAGSRGICLMITLRSDRSAVTSLTVFHPHSHISAAKFIGDGLVSYEEVFYWGSDICVGI